MLQPIFSFVKDMRNARDRELKMASENPFLVEALEKEKMEGHRMSVWARTIALGIIMLMLPILNWHPSVLYYQSLILLSILIGWWQYSSAKVGYSKNELRLIFLDVLLLSLIFVLPYPFYDEAFPSVAVYRFHNFPYFFIVIAVAFLAYSWRTLGFMMWSISLLWILGILGHTVFGNKIPELDAAAIEAFEGYEILTNLLMPNSIGWDDRIEEIVILIMVCVILMIKGYRTNNLLIQQAEVAAQRANLSRYFPSNLVDTLASSDHGIGDVKTQEVAVIFTDIVGFTQYAEENPPQEVMDLLRDYHSAIESAIFENGGTLEKYIGDGVMATFGRPEAGSDDAANAVRAAQQIIEENLKLNQRREDAGLKPVKVSIGMHFGPVIIGDIGPSRRMEFAVVGDTVNVASRLEAETRNLDCHCVASDALMAKVDSEMAEDLGFAPKGEVSLRGRSKPVNIWAS